MNLTTFSSYFSWSKVEHQLLIRLRTKETRNYGGKNIETISNGRALWLLVHRGVKIKHKKQDAIYAIPTLNNRLIIQCYVRSSDPMFSHVTVFFKCLW